MPVITGTNTTTTSGEVLIISFDSAFLDVKTIDSYTDIIVGATANRYFINEFRWSDDAVTYSAWNPLIGTGATSFSGIPNAVGDDVWLELRYTRGGTAIGDLSVTDITINITSNETESVAIPPNASSCGQPNFCAGIRVSCDSNLWNPYDQASAAACLQEQLACAISDMFGHCVKYFKVDPQARSKDVILKEYSLYNVNDIKEIKIVVPDNEFPDNSINFNAFDMDFEPDFEVHITKEVFETVFGQNRRPQERDYLYFPLTDRMYEVNSAYLFKDFMQQGVYYKVGLRKWQDRVNVARGATADQIVEDLTVDFEELLGQERDDEFIQITKPLQYNIISTGGYDFIRSDKHADLAIANQDINNYFTIIAKYNYELNTVPIGELAVRYKTKVDIEATDNRSFTSWFNIEKTNYEFDASAQTTIIDGQNGTNGFSIILDTALLSAGGTGITGTTGMTLDIGATSYVFNTAFPILDPTKWYGLVVNASNTYSEVSIYIWEMKYDPVLFASDPTTAQTTDLQLVYSETQTITMGEQKPADTFYELLGGELAITNLRIFNTTIEEEKQPFILNQYVVKDNHLSILIDNGLPRLNMPRHSNR